MRALITGCAGFIGSQLSESLLADGHSVVGVDCFTDNYARSRKLSNLLRARQYDEFELQEADLAEAELGGLLAGCDAIFHLAAEPGVRSSWDDRFELFLRRNVMATQRLLDAAAQLPERPFVFASSSSIYGDTEQLPTSEDAVPRPYSPYGATKLAAEHLCRLYHDNHGLRTVALRYFTVYGPRQRPDMAFHRFCRAAIERRPLTVFGDGTQTRDFTFVGDIVRATRAAAENPEAAGRAYNIGGGSRVSVREVLALLRSLSGGELEARFVDRQRGDVRHTGADVRRAKEELGFAARMPFEDGLRAEFEWMLESSRRSGRASARSVRHRLAPVSRLARAAARPRRRPVAPAPAARFLFYSNEIFGLGHLRRALAVSSQLAGRGHGASSLILSGSPIAPFFSLPPGTDTVKLPSRTRDGNGASPSRALGVDLEDLRALRSKIALASAEAFAPDVVIVDKVPLGLDGELAPTLEWLATQPRRRAVLGLRDIEDSPARVRQRWGPELRTAIENLFDAVLVYGPESSPDALTCLGWDDLEIPVHHVGYLGTPPASSGPEDLPDRYLLATAGGGHDGFEVLASFADAVRVDPLPCPAVIVAGPLMGADEVAALRERSRGLEIEVHPFRTDMPRVVAGARAAVTMAGYNTVSELISAGKPGLLVPRVRPSEEQLTRARTFAARGLQEMLHPDGLTPESMREAIGRTLARRPPRVGGADYRGSERAAEILGGLVADGGSEAPARSIRPIPTAAVGLRVARAET